MKKTVDVIACEFCDNIEPIIEDKDGGNTIKQCHCCKKDCCCSHMPGYYITNTNDHGYGGMISPCFSCCPDCAKLIKAAIGHETDEFIDWMREIVVKAKESITEGRPE